VNRASPEHEVRKFGASGRSYAKIDTIAHLEGSVVLIVKGQNK
jgi:hypothetical protein